jgi:hypothetical protein
MRASLLFACSLVVCVGCTGGTPPSVPTAPSASADASASTASPYTVSGSVFTFGGQRPARIVITAPGGPSAVVDEEGRFELRDVPPNAAGLHLQIDGRELRLTLQPPGRGQTLLIEIRVDLGVGRADVARRCALSAPPSGVALPAAAVAALCSG